jgi:hypothetical protein
VRAPEGPPLDHVLAALEGARPDADPFYDYLYCASWELVSPAAQCLLMSMAHLPLRGGTWEDLAAASRLAGLELGSAIEELITRRSCTRPGSSKRRAASTS